MSCSVRNFYDNSAHQLRFIVLNGECGATSCRQLLHFSVTVAKQNRTSDVRTRKKGEVRQRFLAALDNFIVTTIAINRDRVGDGTVVASLAHTRVHCERYTRVTHTAIKSIPRVRVFHIDLI